jgi:two-component system alkaline phosphatase synthesis response regulator PhoP
MSNNILIIGHENNIVNILKTNLQDTGYIVETSNDGLDGFIKLRELKPSLVILDWSLPSVEGINILRQVKKDKDFKTIPIIMLNDKNSEEYKIEALNSGADDYITKPFNIKEVISRVNSVLRGYEKKQINSKYIDEFQLNLDAYEIYKNGIRIDVTIKEFEILRLLLENRGKIISRKYLLDKIWGSDSITESRIVDVHIRHIRKKLQNHINSTSYIKTIRGLGYKIE